MAFDKHYSDWFYDDSRILIYDTSYIMYVPSQKSVSLKN